MATISVPSMQDLLSAGVHFGHKVSRGHPKMKPYVFGARDGIDIIDLARSEEKLKEASQAAYELGKSGGVLLVVGTKKQAKDIVASLAREVGAAYLTAHWIGGVLTNFDEIKKNFKKLTSLKEEQEKGLLNRYTKKEQLLISRKLTKFETEAGGAAQLEKVPEAMFVIDAVSDNTAVKEGLKMGVKMFGISDTNADPNWFDYPIPANDDGIKSIKLICETVLRAYGQGKKELGIKNEQLRIKEEKAKDAKGTEAGQTELDAAVAEQTAAIEEEVEKATVQDSDRKV